MEPIPIRIHENTKEALEYEAADRNISVSAYTRSLLQKGREFDSDEHDDDVVEKYTTGGSQQNVSQLRAMTLRVESSTEDQLKSEAADNDTDLSEHIRDLIAKGPPLGSFFTTNLICRSKSGFPGCVERSSVLRV